VLLPDQAVRERAASATDCNLVVNAGAGTGKTTLLVDRFLHLLFRPDQGCSLGHIVALTFTNKAAREMKVRLRGRLLAMREMGQPGSVSATTSPYDEEFAKGLQMQYGLSREHLRDTADRAIQEFERAQIVTIHGFAAHLLRLFPIEGRVDPSFQEDEGPRLRRHFEEEWAGWLEQELGPAGRNHHLWRPILTQVKLQDVEALAWAFMDELVPLPESPWPAQPNGLPLVLRQWLSELAAGAARLRQGSSRSGVIEQMLEVAARSLEELIQSPDGSIPDLHQCRKDLDRSVPPKTITWKQDDYDRARTILQITRAIYGPETARLGSFVSHMVPFIQNSRQRFVESGWMSFSGLLARARTMLRNHPKVRREVKSQIRALLVDEFQDTDPVQYELILLLAEALGEEAQDWRSIRLEPGKLFIVGDSKQSIYAFRRADIEAYDIVIQDCVLGGPSASEQHSLQCNFRSHPALLAPINACFARLFPQQAQKGLQPCYEALLTSDTGRPAEPGEGMELRVVIPTDAEADTEQATRDEAEALARWLKEEVVNVQEIQLNGVPVRIRPHHVAVLLRTLTQMRVYLEAFRRYELPYLTEGEKHFFERQEIRDCLCLLRVLANPHDRIALVGVLRSPVGGCSDIQVAQLFLDERWKYWEEHHGSGPLPAVYPVLRELRQRVRLDPLSDIMDMIFEKLPLLELAAATVDGEQAVANLLKLRDMVQELAVEPDSTFRGLVDQLLQWVEDEKTESEASLTEELMDDQGEEGAIRVLSIHKAKGLEFPMTVVAGLQQSTDGRSDRVWVSHDWLTDLVGFRMGPMRSVSGIFMESKLTERSRAEQVRLLYVAFTRAQRRLVLSAGLPSSNTWKRRSLLALVEKGFHLSLEEEIAKGLDQEEKRIPVGEGHLRLSVIRPKAAGDGPVGWKSMEWQQVDEPVVPHHTVWKNQKERLADHASLPLFLSPTRVGQSQKPGRESHARGNLLRVREVESTDRVDPGGKGRMVGIVAHRVLQGWDFASDPETLPAWIQTCCQSVCISGDPTHLAEWLDDVQSIFAKFVRSAPYTRLCEADILGREVPFAISWAGSKAIHQPNRSGVMQGVVDVVYRWQGEVWVADYKTDQVAEETLDMRTEEYREQVEIYRLAVARSLGLGLKSVKPQLIFLRSSQSVEWS